MRDTSVPIRGQTPTRAVRSAAIRPWLGRIGLLTVSLALTLLVLEAGARLYATAIGKRRGMEYSPIVGWKLLPNIEKSGPLWCGKVPARTNSHGFRDAEHPFAKPKGIRRAVALGDSFTFGQGVDYGERFSEILEHTIDRFEVINMGVAAYGPDQELLSYEAVGHRYSPDIVLHLIYLANDLSDLRFERHHSWPKPYFRLEDGELELVPPKKTLQDSLRNNFYLAEAVFRSLEKRSERSRKAAVWDKGPTTRLFAAIEKRLADEVAASGARLLVILLQPFNVRPDKKDKRTPWVTRALDQAGIPYVDTYDALMEHWDHWKDLWLPCTHWTPFGHEVVANLIRREIDARGLLTPR